MKAIKLPNDFLKSSELSQIVLPIADTIKTLSTLKAAFQQCVVLSSETGKPVIDPFKLKLTLKRTQDEATKILTSTDKIYESLRQWSVAECARVTTAFEPKLRAFCEKESYKLDGRYPHYLIDGFLAVRVRDAQQETEIGTRSVPSLLLDQFAETIRELVSEERARKFDRNHFLESVYRAYERCLLLQKASPGDPMPIRKIYQELVVVGQTEAFLKSGKKSLFNEYTVEFFARDLTKLLESGICQSNAGKWMAISPTSFAPEGIPILQEGQARIVGRIAFSDNHA